MRASQDYRVSTELPALPKANEEDGMPLIEYVTPGNRVAISKYQIRKIVKPLLLKAAGLIIVYVGLSTSSQYLILLGGKCW